MDLMKLFGTVIAVLFHPGSASKINGQRICRRGTERPCYKVSYIQDSRRRLTFEEARQACRLDGGELLSIETESEQRLIERFIKQLQAGDGDFWIGLRRGPQRYRAGTTSPGCPSQYYWLDGSKAKFRNWHWDEPSCGGEMCVVLYHQPSIPPDEGHFLFQWNDDNCNSKNNFVCKYPEKKVPVFTEEGKTAHAGRAVLILLENYKLSHLRKTNILSAQPLFCSAPLPSGSLKPGVSCRPCPVLLYMAPCGQNSLEDFHLHCSCLPGHKLTKYEPRNMKSIPHFLSCTFRTSINNPWTSDFTSQRIVLL
uniref:C-type lectin domain-containing protein n=1 Tax=Monopterus albus TaxID=43700 RepID=A0A3Q3QDC9_MONAL